MYILIKSAFHAKLMQSATLQTVFLHMLKAHVCNKHFNFALCTV